MERKYIEKFLDKKVWIVCDDRDETTYEGTLVEYLEQDYNEAVVLVSDDELVKISLSEIRSISIA